MEIKKFQGRTLSQALSLAVAAGGPDVPIVETKVVEGGVVVVAGVESGAVQTERIAPLPRPKYGPTSRRGGERVPAGIKGLMERLESTGIPEDIRKIVYDALCGCDLFLNRPGDPGVPKLAARILGGLIKWKKSPGQDAPVVAMVGPTGVGKTTTLAKMASRAAIDEGREVALITMDTYRIGAVEQFRAFADLLGAPLSVVFTPQDLKEALHRHRNAERIFIDTTGRGPLDVRRVREIQAFLRQIQCESLLALPAGGRLPDLRAAGRTFGMLRPKGLVLTKWDETSLPGEAITYAIQSGLPLTWVTDGQEVPDDLHQARPDFVALGLVTGEPLSTLAREEM